MNAVSCWSSASKSLDFSGKLIAGVNEYILSLFFQSSTDATNSNCSSKSHTSPPLYLCNSRITEPPCYPALSNIFACHVEYLSHWGNEIRRMANPQNSLPSRQITWSSFTQLSNILYFSIPNSPANCFLLAAMILFLNCPSPLPY